MKYKGSDHVSMAGNVLLCEHCGGRQPLALPQTTESVAGLMKAWGKAHKKCVQTPGVSAFRYAKRLNDWPTSDDTGMSSRAIYSHMRGYPVADPRYPLDPSDFGRCYRLLALAPDWVARIGEMARYGPEWAALAAAWGELTSMYEAELPTGNAPRMYARMKELLTVAS